MVTGEVIAIVGGPIGDRSVGVWRKPVLSKADGKYGRGNGEDRAVHHDTSA
jgi:hypothetical protein